MNLYLKSILSCFFRDVFEIQKHLSHGMSLESRVFSSACSSIHARACACARVQYHGCDHDGHVHVHDRDEHGYDHALDDAHVHGYIFSFIF